MKGFYGVVTEQFEYEDEEGDLITISSDRDYQTALEASDTILIRVPSSLSILMSVPELHSESDSEEPLP